LLDLKSSPNYAEFQTVIACDRPFSRVFQLPSFIRLVFHVDPLSFLPEPLSDDQRAFVSRVTRDRHFQRDSDAADASVLEAELAKFSEDPLDLSWLPETGQERAFRHLPERWIATVLHHRLPLPDDLSPEGTRYLTLQPHWIGAYLRNPSPLLLLPEHYRVLYGAIADLHRIEAGDLHVSLLSETSADLPAPAVCYVPRRFEPSLDLGGLPTLHRPYGADLDGRMRKREEPEREPDYETPILPTTAFALAARERCENGVVITRIISPPYLGLIVALFGAPSLFAALSGLSSLKNEPARFKSLLAIIGRDPDPARAFLSGLKSAIPSLNSTELTAATALLVGMSSAPGFTAPFLEILVDLLLLTVLKPRFRLSQQLLSNTSRVLAGLRSAVPGRSLHLVNTMLLSGDDFLTEALMPYAKLSPEERDAVFSSVRVAFDRVVAKAIARDIAVDAIKTYIAVLPTLVVERRGDFLVILRRLLERFEPSNSDGIADMFRVLAPQLPPDGPRVDIPPSVVAEDPDFWKIVLDFRVRISQMIAEKPALLETAFPFALRYSFLLDFPLKFKLFRDKMRERQSRRRTRIRVRRDAVLADSFEQLRFADRQTLLGELAISFVGEPGIDMGGVRRDWYTALVRALFNPEYALFTPERVPNAGSGINPDHLKFFAFAGRIIAKAVFDGVPLDCHLPAFLCKEIVGAQIGLGDFEADPTFASLKWILENDPEPLEMYFVADEENLGVHKVIPLKDGGEEVLVTNDNKEEYVNLFVRHRLIGRIKAQIEAFVNGFHTILTAEDVQMFAPNELDLLICGVPTVDVKDMRAHCAYAFPLHAEHPLVHRFFAVIRHWSKEDLAKLLLFVTGSSQVPVGGFKAFADAGSPFTIAAGGGAARLPVAHTCTNTIDLPDYGSEQALNEKLHLAITECSTFGLA
jgi:hypothetical protein